MKKNILALILISIAMTLFANEDIKFYKDFITINNAFVGKSLLAEQTLTTYDLEKNKAEKLKAVSFFSGESQLTYFDKSYFLGTNAGYWIMNNRMKTPLKVSGNYQVQQLEIQDILRIDCEKDYLIEKYENNCVYLSRTNKKILYPFLEVSKLSDSKYEILFKDKNGKKIKRAVYKNGYVSGYNCFYEIEIYDLIFNKNTYFVYITNLIKKQKLPASLFNQNQMYNLITFIKQNGFITE
jgi:hypothetical protein